jgi:hypothetical protein
VRRPVTEVAQAGQEAGGRHHQPAASQHRLHDHGADRMRRMFGLAQQVGDCSESIGEAYSVGSSAAS